MSGKYKGTQEIILKINKYAMYIPCAGHSTNLVGRAAVDCCFDAVNFFGIIQEIYHFLFIIYTQIGSTVVILQR